MQAFSQNRRIHQAARDEYAKYLGSLPAKESSLTEETEASPEETEDPDTNRSWTSDTRPSSQQQTIAARNTRSLQLAERAAGLEVGDRHGNGAPKNFIVECGEDKEGTDPRSWPLSRRIYSVVLVSFMVFVCGWASAADSSSNGKAAREYGVSKEAESLATALYLFGNAIGALLAGPISETVGRNASYFVSGAALIIMLLISALAPNLPVQLVFRFLSGFTASPAMTIYGGSLADMFDDMERSHAWPFVALAPILGPILAPIAGGWLIQSSSLTWHWVDWVTLIITSFAFLLGFLFLPETYSPILLLWKAHALRELTGDKRFKSVHELQDPLVKRLSQNITRPIIFFTHEPIIIAMGLYLTLIYVLVFTFLDGFTYLFVDTYGFSVGIRGTCFSAMAAGVLINTALSPVIAHHYTEQLQKAQSNNGPTTSIAPEARLWPAIFTAPLLPISLFWLGWTNYPSISPWAGIIAIGVFGFSLQSIFVSAYQYVIDSYETDSASALASITFLRYMVAGGMVIADMPMYNKLGVHWTLTLLGIIGALLAPMPALFYNYGDKIRARSRFAKDFAA